MIKEITPFLYNKLFKKRFDTYEQYQNVFKKWMEQTEDPIGGAADAVNDKPLNASVIYNPIKEHSALNTNTINDILKLNTTHAATPTTPFPERDHINKFIPKKPDTLFWSLFVGHYGQKEFFTIESKYMNREIEEKLKMIEVLKKSEMKSCLKQMKLTSAMVNEILGDLMTNRQTSLMTIPAFVLFFERSIWIQSTKTQTYVAIDHPLKPDSVPILIYRESGEGGGMRPKYTVNLSCTTDEMLKIKQEFFRLEQYNKVMKGESSYKTHDLEEIVAKARLPIETNLKKKELFVAIARILQQEWDTDR